MANIPFEPSTDDAGRVPFRVELEHSNQYVRVLAAGEMDAVALDHLDEMLTLALRARRRPRVEVDLRAVTLIDVAAIDVLLDAARYARAMKGALWVANPPPQFRHLLPAADTGQVLEVRSRVKIIDPDS